MNELTLDRLKELMLRCSGGDDSVDLGPVNTAARGAEDEALRFRIDVTRTPVRDDFLDSRVEGLAKLARDGVAVRADRVRKLRNTTVAQNREDCARERRGREKFFTLFEVLFLLTLFSLKISSNRVKTFLVYL